MALHDGHRQRLKDRFRSEGLDHFEERHVLELLLSYSIPRKDTAPLAKELLAHFGSFTQVMEATPEELQKVKGVGEHTATLIALTTAVGRYYAVQRATNVEILDSTTKCGRYLVHQFFGRRNETVFLLGLDAKCKVLCCREVGEGSVNSANIPVRRVVEMALAANATTVVIAHNHPSGVAVPSDEDVATTYRLARALDAVEITLADHIVVADEDFVSLVQSGWYHPNQCAVIV